MKKIPLWKLTVKSWNPKEFKGQVAVLTDDMIAVIADRGPDVVAIQMAEGEAGARDGGGLSRVQEWKQG